MINLQSSYYVVAGSSNGRKKRFEVVVIKQSCCPFLSAVLESFRDMSSTRMTFDIYVFGYSM